MANLAPQAPFSSREFRDALGQFATGVTIVTARSPQGHPVGVTVSSFNSVSLTPPLVLWSMALSAASLPVFQHCSHYAIHVLSASQSPWPSCSRARAWTASPTPPGAARPRACRC